ncbi:transcriptional adapter 2B isoform X1 [Bombyx mandarina]|uniref:Transcriptional adapter n=2 Tax=Bombyx TaxID=7090 RepID=A0A8R2C562_BOMMO|nr:transcriptional adapter 2B isoform X1 [Bombyx mori]XP_028036651.1 transcriptional adapter 2B isoform X1 [Bombyx mandarina]
MSFSDLYAKYNCTYCQEEINGVRVKCTECVDFDICLQCFSLGAEIGQHKNDHSYQFVDSGAFGIFLGRSSWSANEEVRLLDAIEQFGFGNWEDIAKHIETRTPEEAKDEYITRYLEGTIGKATWGNIESTSRPSLHCADKDDGPLGPTAVSRLPNLAITVDEAAQLGYMPNRDDFEREHDHEAEQLISTLSLNPEDDELDVALKLSQVDIYIRRLRERTRRKRLVRDFQLVSVFFNNQRNKQKTLGKLAKEKKEFTERLRWMAQFYGRAEQACVSSGLWRERELRVRLAELHRYRLAGVTRLEECAHHDQHAALRRSTHHDRNGSSGCPETNQTRDQTSINSLQQRKRDGESGSNSTSPKCTRDGSTACGCSKKSSCNSNSAGCSRNLLTTNEIQLCSALSLPPAQYVTLKGVLLRRAPAPDCDLDLSVTHYLHAAGWIRN